MKKLELVNLPELPFEMSEAVNQFRINLGFCGANTKVVMLTSSVPNEGKSMLSLCLWRQIAEVGTRVVLIDCDFRKSELRYTSGFHSNDKIVGGAYYLSGKAEIDDVVYETNIPNGYLIPVTASVANPTIMLEGERFRQLIEYCKEHFDYVLIDTPPVASVADALNIATHCDGSVLVVRSGETPRRMVENSVQLLQRTGTPLLGVVLNRADMVGKAGGYYHRYSRYHNYYQGYGNDKNKK